MIGIFPASHVHVRDELPDAEGRLAQIIARTRTSHSTPAAPAPPSAFHMATLREDDEMSLSDLRSNPHLHPHANYLEKQEAPRPTLKSGDETASGLAEPLVDEIASALREWHARLFTYLSRRDYRTFTAVREHIDALHLGRRQLLARTLEGVGGSASVGLISADEAVALRRECVMRLVRGNVAQGLDVLVRHPAGGALVGVEADFTPTPITANANAAPKRSDTSNWVSSIRMYAMQSALAYIDAQGNGTGGYKSSALGPVQDLFAPPAPLGPGPGSKQGGPMIQSSPSYTPQSRSRSHSASQLYPRTSPSNPPPTQRPKFFHLYLDLRAFVAAPCAPGELTELFFSIYSRASAAFVTEDFCVLLNRSGVRVGSLEADEALHSPDGGVGDVSEFGLVGASGSGGALGLALNIPSGPSANGSSLALNLSLPISPLSPSSPTSTSIRTLFTDLGAHDLAEGLVLVCKIVRRGGMKMAPDGDGSSKTDNTTVGASYGQTASHQMVTINESYTGTMSEIGHGTGGMGNGSRAGGSVGASARRGSEPMYRSVWEDSMSQLGDKNRGKNVTSPAGKKSTGSGKNGSAGRNGLGVTTEEEEPLRRPFGCAVLELDALLAPMLSEHGAGVGAPGAVTGGGGTAAGIGSGASVGGGGGTGFGPAREYTMPIFVPVDEARFSTLHQDILQGHGHAVEKSPR